MTQFKDKIPAAGGKVEFLYDTPTGRLDTRISGTGFMAMYLVAVSMDGRHLLATVPAMGYGATTAYPQPSVLTYIQSDNQGMWGRNCPRCKKYFRTNHVVDDTVCPYCSDAESSLAFISAEQRTYITAFYDAFARAYIGKKDTSLDLAEITDQTAAWHYSEEKLQFHFECDSKDCHAQTDILGKYGYCPRCGRTNARKLFFDWITDRLAHLDETRSAVTDRHARGAEWEDLVVKSLSEFETLAKHLRTKLFRLPMTPKRRQELERVNFQRPLDANQSLEKWFDIGVLEWAGDEKTPPRRIPDSDLPFVTKMIQKRHILMHNGGIVDQDYLDQSGDTHVRLNERIAVRSNEAKRFIDCIHAMSANLLDNVEDGIREG